MEAMEAVVMEAVVMESTAGPTVESAAGPAPSRDRGGEGEGQHSHERHTENLLHDRLLLASVHVSVRRMGSTCSCGWTRECSSQWAASRMMEILTRWGTTAER